MTYDVRGAGALRRTGRAGPTTARERLVDDLVAVLDAVLPRRGGAPTWSATTGARCSCGTRSPPRPTDPRLRGRIASFTSVSGPSLDHAALADPGARVAAGGRCCASSCTRWYIVLFCLPVVPELMWRLGARPAGRAGDAPRGAAARPLGSRAAPQRRARPRRSTARTCSAAAAPAAAAAHRRAGAGRAPDPRPVPDRRAPEDLDRRLQRRAGRAASTPAHWAIVTHADEVAGAGARSTSTATDPRDWAGARLPVPARGAAWCCWPCSPCCSAALVAVAVRRGAGAPPAASRRSRRTTRARCCWSAGTAARPAPSSPLRAGARSGPGGTSSSCRAVGGGTGDIDEQADALGRRADAAMRAVRRRRRSTSSATPPAGWSPGRGSATTTARAGPPGAQRRLAAARHHGRRARASGSAAACPAACRQLEPDSDLLRSLNARDETPHGPSFVSVWSDDDEVVVPADSARLSRRAEPHRPVGVPRRPVPPRRPPLGPGGPGAAHLGAGPLRAGRPLPRPLLTRRELRSQPCRPGASCGPAATRRKLRSCAQLTPGRPGSARNSRRVEASGPLRIDQAGPPRGRVWTDGARRRRSEAGEAPSAGGRTRAPRRAGHARAERAPFSW